MDTPRRRDTSPKEVWYRVWVAITARPVFFQTPGNTFAHSLFLSLASFLWPEARRFGADVFYTPI